MELVNHSIRMGGSPRPQLTSLFLDTETVIFGLTVCVGALGYKYMPPHSGGLGVIALAGMPTKADGSRRESRATIKQMC